MTSERARPDDSGPGDLTPGDTPAGFRPSETLVRLYPEADVGGFTRHDGFVEFYTRVNALLHDESTVLDFGAGRGLWATEPLPAASRSCAPSTSASRAWWASTSTPRCWTTRTSPRRT